MTSHAPIIEHYPGTHWEPEEITVTCTCGSFEYTSQESIGGPVEPWGEYWEDHLAEVDLNTADCGETA